MSSVKVFLSWHGLHKACQFSRSQNSLWSPRCGMIWSTTVAVTYLPCFMHPAHSGWLCRNLFDSLCHLLLYPRLPADLVTSGCSFKCSTQYFFPGSTRAAHPGCLQGTLGLYGIYFISFSTQLFFLHDTNINNSPNSNAQKKSE